MSISNSIDFSLTRDDIITEALELLGVLGEDETPSSGQLTSCSRTLNIMTKAWQAEHINLFAEDTFYVFLEANKHEYIMSSSGDNVATDYSSTQLASAASASATTVSVDSDDAVSDGDYIGIQLDDGSMQWTTVNGAPVGDVVTLTDALSGDAAEDSYVFSYTTKANRPMKLIRALIRDVNEFDVPVDIINQDDYFGLPDKITEGKVTQVAYNPGISAGVLTVYGETDDVTDVLVLRVQRTLSDFDSSTDNPDFPQEWYLALSYNLAVNLAPKYGIDGNDFQRLFVMADSFLDIASSYDRDVSVILGADRDN